MTGMLAVGFLVFGFLIDEILAGRISEIASGGCPQILVPHLLVIGLNINAVGSGLTDVCGYSCLKSHGFRHVRPVHEDVCAVFPEVLGNYVNLVEQPQLDCEIGLVGFFPCNLLISIAKDINTGIAVIPCLTKGGTAGRTVHIHFGKVVKTIRLYTNIVVAHQSVRSTEFEVVDILVQTLEPRFVGHDPGESCRREKSPAVGLVETFGAIVTEVELSEITFVVTISKAA